MKGFAVACLLFVSTYASAYTFSDKGCTKAQISAAQKELALANDRFKVGEITKTDVAMAEMKVLEITYCSENPNPVSITCLDMTSKEQTVLDGFRQELMVGLRTYQEYGAELSKAGALFTFCGSGKY